MTQSFVGAEPRPGFIYVIAEKTSAGDYTGYYKVGKSQNIDARISKLQIGNPHELVCVKTIPVEDMDAAERSAHGAIYRYRSGVTGGKEWYYASQQFYFLCGIELMVKGYPGVIQRSADEDY